MRSLTKMDYLIAAKKIVALHERGHRLPTWDNIEGRPTRMRLYAFKGDIIEENGCIYYLTAGCIQKSIRPSTNAHWQKLDLEIVLSVAESIKKEKSK